jgi:hypothetical protein
MRLALLLPLLLCVGCTAVSRGSKLSDRPPSGKGLFLSTGGSPRPFRTLGFVQLTGYGVTVAGLADMGDAALDSVIKGKLADEALKLGGDGVIHIEFIDENPPTDVERAMDFSETLTSGLRGEGEIKTRNRSVVVTGEVIEFLSSQP